jgi:opacity protein-like surface antigen
MHKTFFLFLVAAAPLLAQTMSLGIKAGVPLNDALSVKPTSTLQYLQDTHRYTVGPYVELRLPAHLVIEIDALYRSYEYRRVVPTLSTQTANSWEFPVLGKYKLLGGPIRPYIEGGVAFSRLTDIPDVVELKNRNNYGVVLGGGVEFHLGIIRITPEIRYNGWTLRNFTTPLGQLQSNRNQAAVLVGIGF